METLLVSNIVRYAIHDGDGLRTTVFLKGCTLHCPWCANPETISAYNQYWFDSEKCVGNQGGCPFHENCSRDAAVGLAGKRTGCFDSCPMGAVSQVAKDYTPEELFAEIIKDRLYWGNDGGVTFSGGEPVLQIVPLLPLMKMLKDALVNIAFETAGNVPASDFEQMLKCADFVYLDIKNIVPEKAGKLNGLDVKLYETNLSNLSGSGVPFCLRLPLIRPYTLCSENIDRICQLVKTLNHPDVEIFACHALGDIKRKWLGLEKTTVMDITDTDLKMVEGLLKEAGAKVRTLSKG